MPMSSAGLSPEKDYADEAQQQLKALTRSLVREGALHQQTRKILRSLSARANYTSLETAACRRS
jgi:hypothetical protein